MNQFHAYLSNLPKSPLIEAVKSLYESLTPADIQLGKYIKGFNNGVKVPPIPNYTLMRGNARLYYMVMARNHKLVARLLQIGTRITEDNKPQIKNEIVQLLKTFVKDPRGSSYESIADNMVEYMEDADKQKLAECAELYDAGKSDLAYNMLSDAFPNGYGGFAALFTNQINKGVVSDARYMVMDTNPKKSLLRNHWLIHGTRVRSGLSIIRDGFDRGNKIGDLAYNRSVATETNPHDYGGDYLFAYDATDKIGTYHESNQIKPDSYGKFMLMFKASGYKIFHVGDYESQVMFDYHEPNAFFFILDSESATKFDIPVGKYNYSLYGCYKDENGNDNYKVIVSNDEIAQIVKWVVQFGDQYEKLMFHTN